MFSNFRYYVDYNVVTWCVIVVVHGELSLKYMRNELFFNKSV
jgi:hypothetical protein